MIHTLFFNIKSNPCSIMALRMSNDSHGKAILYHLHILDDSSEIPEDLSEYPC